MASRRLLQVVTDPNTPGTSAAAENDAPANDNSKVSSVVDGKVAVISATEDSTHPNDTPLSYTMYASVSASGNTKYEASPESCGCNTIRLCCVPTRNARGTNNRSYTTVCSCSIIPSVLDASIAQDTDDDTQPTG